MGKLEVLALIGVRISAKLGIRTFRAVDDPWREHRVEDIATLGGSSRSPELVQSFYSARRHQLQQSEIQPNAAYIALAKPEVELGDRFLLVIQDIDNLYKRAGSQNAIHMHGRLLKVRCSQGGQILEWTGDVTPEDKYRCYQFSAPLRPHVVWFGEIPLGMDEIHMTLTMVDVFTAVDTSGHVYPAADLVHKVQLHGAHTVELSLKPSQIGNEFEEKYYDPVSQVVPKPVEKLLKGL